jgi:hypothetical protein
MKRLLLLSVLSLTMIVGCSKDSETSTDKDSSVTQGCYMKVMGIGHGTPSPGVDVYSVNYGTSDKDQVVLITSKDVWDFYLDRTNKGNDHWIGEVSHE